MWLFTAAFYRTQPIENAQMPLDKLMAKQNEI